MRTYFTLQKRTVKDHCNFKTVHRRIKVIATRIDKGESDFN